MSTVAKVRREVARFGQLMESKLRENDHKGGWKHEPLGFFTRRMGDEMRELRRARAKLDKELQRWPYDTATVARLRADCAAEAADVANFAMMIADVCGALTKGRP